MKKYSICTMKGDDGFDKKYFNTLEEARLVAKERAENERFTAQEINKNKPYVLISLEEVDEDSIDYIDSIEAIEITEPRA